jgi:DNA-binding CsgD family transcriptional regulator
VLLSCWIDELHSGHKMASVVRLSAFSLKNTDSLPGEVALIALISSGKSGRAISQMLGIGMATIRQHCRRIHGKIGTHSRLAIGLWAIRNGMVTSAVQSSGFPSTGPITRGPAHEIQTAAEEKLWPSAR